MEELAVSGLVGWGNRGRWLLDSSMEVTPAYSNKLLEGITQLTANFRLHAIAISGILDKNTEGVWTWNLEY